MTKTASNHSSLSSFEPSRENLLIKGNNLIALHSLIPVYGGGG